MAASSQQEMTDPPIYEELNAQQNRHSVPQQQQPGVHYMSQPAPRGTSGQVQVPYLPPVPQTGMVVQKPGHPGPSDFLIFAVIVLVVCGLLNVSSLFLGIPAVIFAAKTKHQCTVNHNYKAAKITSDITIGLIIATIIYTLVLTVILASFLHLVVVNSPLLNHL